MTDPTLCSSCPYSGGCDRRTSLYEACLALDRAKRAVAESMARSREAVVLVNTYRKDV